MVQCPTSFTSVYFLPEMSPISLLPSPMVPPARLYGRHFPLSLSLSLSLLISLSLSLCPPPNPSFPPSNQSLVKLSVKKNQRKSETWG